MTASPKKYPTKPLILEKHRSNSREYPTINQSGIAEIKPQIKNHLKFASFSQTQLREFFMKHENEHEKFSPSISGFYDYLKKHTIAGKVFFILSVIMMMNSIASLSDTFVQWIGFFQEVIKFHHEYITPFFFKVFNPITYMLIDRELNNIELDMIIIFLIEGASWGRVSLKSFPGITGYAAFSVHLLLAATSAAAVPVFICKDECSPYNIIAVLATMAAINASFQIEELTKIKHAKLSKNVTVENLYFEKKAYGLRTPRYLFDIVKLGKKGAYEKSLNTKVYPYWSVPTVAVIMLCILSAFFAAIEKIVY